MKISIALLVSLVFSLLVTASAEPVQSATQEAPPLRLCEVVNERDLGAWDDAFICSDQDMIILRRGETLYLLSLTAGAAPKELTRASALAHARIVTCAPSGGKLWLLLESTKMAPFGFEAHSGQVSEFTIPGLTIPGIYTPGIQSHVVVRHADAVVLMVSGGDRQTWPRDGNRPVYFWMSLKSGRVVRFPIGWDLEYFSRDQRVVVFEKPHEKPFQRRPLQAVDMETGESVETPPGRGKDGYVAFNWTETQEVKPLYVRRAETNDRDHFAGISLNGQVLSFNLQLEHISYLSNAREADGFAGFRLRREGAGSGEPSSLWLMRLEDSAEPEYVAPAVTDFAMLKNGNCVFTTDGYGNKEASSEAFFRAGFDRSVWNVLNGEQRLPELEREIADKDYVEDRLTVRLIEGIGTGNPIVLCLFQHVRGDMRALTFPFEERIVNREVWRRTMLVTSEGHRYMTNLFHDGQVPDILWLHNSGTLITGFTEHGKMHLSTRVLQLAHDRR